MNLAVIRIDAKKDARCAQTVVLIQGDRRTQILRFDVNRFDGGVDLGSLRWVIKTTNALGVEDVFDPEAVEIKERVITVDWLVDGSVTNGAGMAEYELNGIDADEDGNAVKWSGGIGSISVREGKGEKFGESEGLTNIERLILYVEGELQNVIDAGGAALDAAERANHAADAIQDYTAAVDRANAAAQRAMNAAAAVEDLEGAVGRANTAATLANDSSQNAEMAASSAYYAAGRATEAAKNVENIEEATEAAYAAAEDARAAANVANTAGLPAAMIYGMRVLGETAKAIGNPVTFLPDAGSLLQPVTVLEPKQAGSGDPCPAGGGKNLMPPRGGESITANGITITANADGSVTYNGTATANLYHRVSDYFKLAAGEYILSGCAQGSSSTTYFMRLVDNNQAEIGFDYGDGYRATFTTESDILQVHVVIANGLTVSNLTFYPMIRLASDPDATYTPYENIRPITGYDAVELNHVGKNLMPVLSGSDSNSYGVEWKNNKDGSWTANGTATYAAYIPGSAMAFVLGVLPAGEYKLNVVASSEETGKLYLRIGSGAGAAFLTSNDSQSKDKECTFVADGVTEYYAAIAIKSGKTVKDYRIFPVLVESSHSVYSINFGQTVYGGKMDWLTGKLIAEYGFYTITGGGSAKLTSASVHNAKCFMTDIIPGAKGNSDLLSGAKSSHFVEGIWNNIVSLDSPFGKFGINTSNKIGIGYDGTIDEANAWLAAQNAAGTPVQIAYKLANPIEIQLTPHIISAVDPEQTNTLYGDGRIEAEYVKPLHVSIEERVAAALAAAKE